MTDNASISSATPAVPSPVKTMHLIRQGQCPKLGVYSSGLITFQILTNESKDGVFLRIAGNDGGGYVSDEAVPFDAVLRCVTERDPDKALRAGDFKPAFIGRSNNNWGFLAAVLLHEGLLTRHPTLPHLLVDEGGWGVWGTAQLDQAPDEPTLVQIGKPPRPIGIRSTPTAPAGDQPSDSAPVDAHADAQADISAAAAPGLVVPSSSAPAEPKHARHRRK